MKNCKIIFLLCATVLIAASCGMLGGKSSVKKKEHDGLILVDSTVKDFYLDRTGKKVFDCPAFDCAEFSEGIAVARGAGSDEPKKFIDKTGKVLFEGKYESVKPFSEGLAIVEVKDPNGGLKGKFGAIDKTGKMVVEPKYELLESFSDGLAMVQSNLGQYNQTCGYIDKTGNLVIPTGFYDGKSFSDGFALVLKDNRAGQWTFIDKTGKDTGWYEKHRHSEALPFSEGLAAIETGSEGWIFIDAKGEKAFELKNDIKFEEVRPFSEGWAAVKLAPESRVRDFQKARPWTFIDTSGKLREGITFEEVKDFSEGMAAVKDGAMWIYVKSDETDSDDLTKKTRFEKAESFSGGLAQVETEIGSKAKKTYVDATGKVVWQEE